MTRRVRVVNATRGETLAARAEEASTPWSRLVGLMGRREVPSEGGLVLRPGGAIHTCFMRVPLDVLHVDGSGRATHVVRGIQPWRVGPLRVGGMATVELPAGAAGATQPGDRITLEDAPPA